MNKQQLASKIWESANKMRSKIEANEYKDYILGFIFYKFLSDKEEKYLKSQDWEAEDIKEYLNEDDHETVVDCQNNLGYFIAYKDLFSTWLAMGTDFSVDNVSIALAAFSRLVNKTHKKVFDGIFTTLETGLSKLGENSSSRTKAISDLIHLIKDIPMDEKQDYDVLGFIYEYLISNFAANAGKKAGEFYTPHEVSLLMSEIVAYHLKDRKEIKIYDPTSGSGSLLINIGKSVGKYMDNKNNIKYYAQELKQNTYNLTRMNLVMRGILPDNIVARNGDTLEEDWPYFDDSDPIGTYDPLYVDAVVSNPPYSQNWTPPTRADARFDNYGLAPKGKADYAFLLHDLFHLKADGIMTIVLPHGVLFRGGEEGEIRKNLIEKNNIDAIIGLPANIFFGTGIPTIIMVLKQKRDNTDVLIIDASKGYVKEGKNNKLRASDIKKISDAYIKRDTVDKFCKVVTRKEIRDNDYNLNIPRYVDSSEKPESWDIYASMFGGIPESELEELSKYWDAFPSLKDELFEKNSEKYYQLKEGKAIKEALEHNADIERFTNHYKDNFSDLDNYLYNELVNKYNEININQYKERIASVLFDKLEDIQLVDKYDVYQLLDQKWATISNDLEIMQTEGFDSVKKVDPNMVIKKKDNKESEVQDGWIGHVIPFEVVQNTILASQKAEIEALDNRLSEISSRYEELIDQLSEDDKEGDFVNEDKTAFSFADAKKAIKQDIEVELKAVLKEAVELNNEEKELKKRRKATETAYLQKTKDTIETLDDNTAKQLLNEKWIKPLIESINGIPTGVVSDLAAKLEKISTKYNYTYAGIEEEINNTEQSLISMIDQLDGDKFDLLGLDELKKLLGGE